MMCQLSISFPFRSAPIIAAQLADQYCGLLDHEWSQANAAAFEAPGSTSRELNAATRDYF
jgi:hypothetical protein